jgi:DNA ligase D-like protein (predicted ligase)
VLNRKRDFVLMQKMPAPLRFQPPMECTPVDKIAEGADWQYELKLDGYRTIAIKQNGEVELFSRNGNSFNARFPQVVEALLKMRPKRFILDGEIVALNEQGHHSFGLLQKVQSSKAAVHFYLFDLLHLDDESLMSRPLLQHRASMEDAFRALIKPLDISPILRGNAAKVVQHVRAFEFEGIVAKRRDSIYLPGKTPGTWQKHKTQQSDDFLVGGYIPGAHGIDQLVVGELRDGELHYVDSVKNGFVPATRRRVFDAIRGGEINGPPFVNLPEKKGPHRMDREKMKSVRWLKPKVVAEIAFNERTESGHLRHSKFLRFREPVELRGKKND